MSVVPTGTTGKTAGHLGPGGRRLPADVIGCCFTGSAFVLLSGPSGIPVKISSAVLCAVALIAVAVRRVPARDFYVPGAAVVFVLWCATSVLWSDYPSQTLVEATTLVLVTATAVICANTFSTSSVLRGIVAGAAAAAALSVLTAIIDPSQGIVNDEYANGALQGIYVHRNILSSALVPGLVAAACGGRALGRRWVTAVLVLVLAVTTVATQSNTALAAGLAAIGVAAAVSGVMWFPRGERLLPAVGAGAGVALVAGLLLQNFGAVIADAGRDLTFTGRTDIWAGVWIRVDDDAWLGHGWGAVWLDGDRAGDFVRSYIGYFVDHSHNGALDVMVQVGWVGIGLVAVLVLQLAVVASQAYAGGATRLGLWPLASFAMFVFYNLSESQLTTTHGWFLLVVTVVAVLRDVRGL